jgi:hypothetical protein
MKTDRLSKILAAVAMTFGALTVFSCGRALFGGAQAQADAGNAVNFVLWFNFLAGFAYMVTAYGLWTARGWTRWAAIVLAASTALVAAAFGWHVLSGGAYEMRTVGAMALRLVFWVAVAIVVNAAFSRAARAG